jgi:hypothetical protein
MQMLGIERNAQGAKRGWIRTPEGNRRIFPVKIVDIGPRYRASSRHR